MSELLVVTDLQVQTAEGKEILRGVNLKVKKGATKKVKKVKKLKK